jgi:hypothetical protein
VSVHVRRYDGDTDVSIIQCIGQRRGNYDYDPTTSRFQVIGLTQDVMIVMETQDIDFILHLLHINTAPPLHVTPSLDRLLITLEMICDELNRYKVLKFGIKLANSVVPHPLEVHNYNWYIMPEGGAYVWDAWRTTRNSNPNIVMFVRLHPDYGLEEGGSGRATVLDHPLHITLFAGNFREYLPPHMRSLARPPR